MSDVLSTIPSAPPTDGDGTNPSRTRGTILVVDDDERLLRVVGIYLSMEGYEVLSAADGEAALVEVARRKPDVVIMDIMMPVMDGYAAMRAIRALDQFKSLPIVAVTGKVVGGERQRCIDAGANDYVPKPVDTASLLAAIGPWLPAAEQPIP